MDVSIIIPTINRPDFLERLLNYYQETGFNGQLLIGDSSIGKKAIYCSDLAKKYGARYTIVYKHLPDANDYQAAVRMSEEISTTYVSFIADDDFLTVNGIKRSIAFLNSHPDYSAVNGAGMLFKLQDSGPYGTISSSGAYPLPNLEQPTAAQRLDYHLSNYAVTFFSVHRTSIWKRMYVDTPIKDKSFGSELLPCCLSSVLGKIKQLEGLYLVRQTHDRRYLLPNMFDWLISPDWLPSYMIFETHLAETISQEDNIDLEEARSVVKNAFWAYLAKGLYKKWIQAQDVRKITWRGKSKKIPGVGMLLRGIRTIMPGRGMSMSSVQSPRSPYHEDFIPVYKAITLTPN